MPHPIKKIYKPGSPGDARQRSGITLTQIKRNIRAGSIPRKSYYRTGVLGRTS